MTANITPIFTLTPVIGKASVGTANTNRDSTGTIATILTGGSNGTRVTRITIKATVTTTAGMLRLYIADAVPNIHLWREIPITAITGSASVAEFESTISLTGEQALILPSGYSLRASVHNAENCNVFAEGGDY